ncbi:class I SAM-dependent methyltransferase [Streptomyces aureus]
MTSTGELAAHLSSSGYTVDAVDWSETALVEARTRHGDAARWLRLDIEGDHAASLSADGYDLITLRFVAPFLTYRDRTLDVLGHRLRPGGALVLITRSPPTPPLSGAGSPWPKTSLHACGVAGRLRSGTMPTGWSSSSCAGRARTRPHRTPRHSATRRVRTTEKKQPPGASITSTSRTGTTGRWSRDARRSRFASPPRRRRPPRSGTPSSSTTGTTSGKSTSS